MREGEGDKEKSTQLFFLEKKKDLILRVNFSHEEYKLFISNLKKKPICTTKKELLMSTECGGLNTEKPSTAPTPLPLVTHTSPSYNTPKSFFFLF